MSLSAEEIREELRDRMNALRRAVDTEPHAPIDDAIYDVLCALADLALFPHTERAQ